MKTLDLIQLHCWPMENLCKPVVWETLRTLQTEGKIARFGASVESVEEARFCMAQEGCVSLQIIFNIFRQHVRDEIFAEAKEKGIAIIVRVPLASGLLGGRFGQGTRFPESDHRNYNRDGAAFHVGETFGGLTFDKGLDLVEKLRGILPPEPLMPVQALRWILDHDAVTTVIPGATRIEQVQANALAASISPLAPELHAHLADFYRDEVAPHVRGQY
jgi:aryl-alcohol dehydrogenase-like predicted oxidoreductase